ncbi:MAG: HAD-IC family P-type ATPase [Patescibacteria group bacterium]|jgi:Ca2+-transporting ATPase
MNKNFHALSVKDCLAELKTSLSGLSTREATSRLTKNGLNELEKKRGFSRWSVFFKQLKNPFIYILLFAGVASLVLSEYTNATVIFTAVFLNALIGFFQENKANNSLEKLRELVKYRAVVKRDGEDSVVDAFLLTVGDIISIEAGARVPADARLLETSGLAVNEAVLTGEPFPADKISEIVSIGASLADRRNMIYAGTTAVSGRGLAVITAIGSETEVGGISRMIALSIEEKTPLQAKLEKLAKFLAIMFLSLCSLVFVLGVVEGRGIYEMFFVGVALAVSSIPEGLLISMTLILVLGMQRLLKNKVLTRKLVSAETLGSTTVICTDKTGTLTEGKMAVARILAGDSEFELGSFTRLQEEKEAPTVFLALRIGALCNNAILENPDEPLEEGRFFGAPTEIALLSAAMEAGLNKSEALRVEPRLLEKQFTSADKFMATLHSRSSGYVLYEKGAPEIILAKCADFYSDGEQLALRNERRERILNNFKKFTTEGFRLMAMAFREIPESFLNKDEAEPEWKKLDEKLCFVGLVVLKDPLRSDAGHSIAEARSAGLRPIIITGDHPLTAKAIALEIGLNADKENILTGEELDKIDDKELSRHVSKIDIYARVSPHHKLRIINAWRERGEVVAMVGDGINDAPALQAADIGIALGTGTDIAKEASDMVLLDNNFKAIVLAVEEGRRIFSNLRKVIVYLVSDSFAEIVLISGAIILSAPLPLLPVQILWLNIIQDGLPNFSLAFEKSTKSAMEKKPKGREVPLLSSKMKAIIFGVGIFIDVVIFIFFWQLFKQGSDITYLRTLMFAILGTKSLVSIFSLRSLSRPIWRLNLFSNGWLWAAVGFSSTFFLLALYWSPIQKLLAITNLPALDWLAVFAFAFANLILIEAVKIFFTIREKKKYAIAR